jgi:ubiquinone/menaquinone biosynthesis C-methylase UbiE
MKTLLSFFFHLLYHRFAFTYDLVAAVVSLGRWKDWITETVPFVEGTRVLEIGYGPGHLQCFLLSRGLFTVGIDESAQMSHLAKRRLDNYLGQSNQPRFLNQIPFSGETHLAVNPGYAKTNLTRGLAQQLPFADSTFDTVLATFPAEYIFDTATLTGAHRVLTATGKFIILPGAVITGRGIWDRFMAWLFRITGETPPNISEVIHEKSKESLARAGFRAEVHELDVRSSIVFIIVATKFLERG